MKIAVLSRNGKLYSTKRLIEAIEAAGHEAIMIDYLDGAIVTDMKGAKIY